MSLPKEPRQKMINMMYLVLTAMLALNVSSEILNAFKTVNNSLVYSNTVIDKKNETIFASFKQELKQPEKQALAALWMPKAEKAKQLADDITSYLEGLKAELKKASGLEITPEGEQFKEDNLDAATRLFVEPGKEKGEEIRKKLETFKEQILNIDPKIKAEFANSLPLNLEIPKSSNKSSVGKDDWAFSYFHMTPTIAAITIFSKFQNDIKNSEAQIVEYCHKQVGEVQVRYDAFQAIASQSSEYLMPGQELRITGGVGAFSSAAKPSVSIDGASVPLNAEGVAEYKTTVGGPGSYSKKVSISFKKPDGSTGVLDKEIKYTVGSPTGVSVSADAVKVLYIGVVNPITISGGSAGAEKVNASISNGSLSNKGGGKFEATVDAPGKATINVSVDGKSTPFEFRVKRIPSPLPKVGNSAGGTMPANAFKAQQGVRADLQDFVFEGVKFDVTGYTIVFQGKGFEEGAKFAQVRGAYFSSDAKQYIDKCRPGSTVNITDISVSGPDGTRKIEGSIALNLSN